MGQLEYTPYKQLGKSQQVFYKQEYEDKPLVGKILYETWCLEDGTLLDFKARLVEDKFWQRDK